MSCSSGPKIITEGLVFNLDPSNSKSYPAINDPYRNDVSVLFPFNGANNSTTFTDFSINNLTVTVNGDTKISNTQSKYGGTSAYFDGNGDSLTITNSTLFDFSGDFTVEGWFYFSQVNQYNGATVFIAMDVLNAFQFATEGNNIRLRFNGSLLIDYAYTASNLLNTWTHLAITRSGSTVTLWLNGTSVATASSSASINVSALWIGQQINNAAFYHYFNGYINDLRITKASRYSSNFTPPGQLTLFPSRAYDLRNDATATLTNGPVFSNVQNGVISFDASNDWISLPASSLLTFGTGDFTIDIWYRPNAKTNLYPQLIGNNITWQANCWALIDRHASTNPTKFSFFVYNYSSVLALLGSSTAPSNNNWYNVTVTRVGSTFSMYVNGILETTATSAASLDGGVSYIVAVGGDSVNGGTTIIDGNIGNLRIYKGKGLSATEVSQNYAGNRQKYVENPRTFSGLAVWFDSADLSTLRQNSNATTAATLNSDPVGYWADKSGNGRNAIQATAGNRVALKNGTRNLDPAVYFNGSQWLSVTTPGVDFGTGDFTIECWIKSLDTSVLKTPVGTLTSGFDGGWQLLQNNSKFGFGIGVGGGVETYDATITQGVWYNFAVCRKGSTLKTFLNGVNGSTITNSSNISQTGTMNIGWANESAQTGRRFNGEIQNLIIYKGFCKYF